MVENKGKLRKSRKRMIGRLPKKESKENEMMMTMMMMMMMTSMVCYFWLNDCTV